MADVKKWGSEEFWGLGYEYDPQWLLTRARRSCRRSSSSCRAARCATTPSRSDKKLLFPRKNFQILAKHGLLGLLVPKELGGMGENHVCAAMVVETIARYGCPSTAMCYTMHTGRGGGGAASAITTTRVAAGHHAPHRQGLPGRHALLFRSRDRLAFLVSDLVGRREGRGRLEGAQEGLLDHLRRLRRLVHLQTTSPDFGGNYADLSCWLIAGQRGQGRALEVGRPRPARQPVGHARGRQRIDRRRTAWSAPRATAPNSNDECVDPFFLLCSSSCWNGISLALIDIAKRHTTMKKHADVGMRVADYPTIQDYVGEAIIDTNACAPSSSGWRKAMDDATNNCDWSIHKDLTALPRAQYPALDVAGEVRRGEERRPCRRQDAACLRRHRLQAGPRHRALSARRQGRLGHGSDQRGAAPVRRQVGAARLRSRSTTGTSRSTSGCSTTRSRSSTAAGKKALAEKLLKEAQGEGGGVAGSLTRPTLQIVFRARGSTKRISRGFSELALGRVDRANLFVRMHFDHSSNELTNVWNSIVDCQFNHSLAPFPPASPPRIWILRNS